MKLKISPPTGKDDGERAQDGRLIATRIVKTLCVAVVCWCNELSEYCGCFFVW
jgi:hypothetical protein